MKKFSFLSAAIMISSVAVVLFISCQKEQTAVADQETSSERVSVNGSNGSGSYAGSVNQSYADALAANYIKKFGDDDKQSQSVAFNAKDLISFLQGLQTKYKSDVIYVNFGLYGKGAPAVNPKNNGRLTVFFTGNKPQYSSGRRQDGTDDGGDDYLNHGELSPPPKP